MPDAMTCLLWREPESAMLSSAECYISYRENDAGVPPRRKDISGASL